MMEVGRGHTLTRHLCVVVIQRCVQSTCRSDYLPHNASSRLIQRNDQLVHFDSGLGVSVNGDTTGEKKGEEQG